MLTIILVTCIMHLTSDDKITCQKDKISCQTYSLLCAIYFFKYILNQER